MPSIQVRAEEQKDGSIALVGDGEAKLPRNSGPHTFVFHLDDQGLGVEWRKPEDGLCVAEDNSGSCPPAQNSSTQIEDVKRPNAKTASFRDKNDNSMPDMSISYALHAKCTADPGRVVHPFDPIIINGGSN